MIRVRMVALLVAGFVPSVASAFDIAIIPNPQGDVTGTFRDDPKVHGLGVEVTALRKRMMRWHERDFRALFGEPFDPGAKDYALMCSEPRALTLSGIRLEGAEDKTHTASYRLGAGARVDVYFQRDGETPSYVIFYLKVDDRFVRLERAAQLEARVTWERAGLWRAVRDTDDRWREVVGWEVDLARAADLRRGFDSPDPEEKLKATIEWGEKNKLRLEYSESAGGAETARRWFRGDVVLAEVLCHCNKAGDGREKPYLLTFRRPDGNLSRDERLGPGVYSVARWYSANSCVIRSESAAMPELGGGWKEASWHWEIKDGNDRAEWDTNGDGIPDEFAERVDGKAGPRQHLAVEKSWAVHPELIPAALRIPDQPDRRVPVRKIPK